MFTDFMRLRGVALRLDCFRPSSVVADGFPPRLPAVSRYPPWHRVGGRRRLRGRERHVRATAIIEFWPIEQEYCSELTGFHV
jgi:hypothetical protein